VRKNSIEKTLSTALLASLLLLSGCGGRGDGAPRASTAAKPFKTSPGTGVLAVDCTRQRAYIPLNAPDVDGNGQVSVIDLSVNPDVTDPRVATISLTHPDIPSGTAFDNDHSLIIVVSGKSSGLDGSVDLIDEATNTLVAGSPFAFPAGSQSGFFGQALYDATNHLAIVGTCDSATCSSGNPLTGFVTFNMTTHTFGTIIAANYPEAFAFNNKTNVVIDASDDDSGGQIGGIDQHNGRACTLTDTNVGGDNDGSSFDSSTGIVVVSNETTNATVINLNKSSFAPGSGTPCTLNEGGTPPNSVLVTRLPSGTAGSAVDPDNHWAFVISDGGAGMALLTLPTAPVAQLVSADITAVSSSFPNDPSDTGWGTEGDPYAVTVASCPALPHKGYAVNDSFTFLAEVDLPTLLNTPLVIPTAPPAGQCTGTTSTVTKCNNGNGVVFFPLPGLK
jgi:hypothetical protein